MLHSSSTVYLNDIIEELVSSSTTGSCSWPYLIVVLGRPLLSSWYMCHAVFAQWNITGSLCTRYILVWCTAVIETKWINMFDVVWRISTMWVCWCAGCWWVHRNNERFDVCVKNTYYRCQNHYSTTVNALGLVWYDVVISPKIRHLTRATDYYLISSTHTLSHSCYIHIFKNNTW